MLIGVDYDGGLGTGKSVGGWGCLIGVSYANRKVREELSCSEEIWTKKASENIFLSNALL